MLNVNLMLTKCGCKKIIRMVLKENLWKKIAMAGIHILMGEIINFLTKQYRLCFKIFPFWVGEKWQWLTWGVSLDCSYCLFSYCSFIQCFFFLHKVFNICLDVNTFPRVWKHAQVVLIPKGNVSRVSHLGQP